MRAKESATPPMDSYLVIREIRPEDDLNCQSLIKDYVMSFVREAFFFCLFREITLQLIILMWAIMFIFFGVPLLFGLFAVPIVIIAMYAATYSTYFAKSMELAQEKPKYCLVAECYEPVSFKTSAMDRTYHEIHENNIRQINTSSMKKKIVGTLSLKSHNALENCDWIHRLAINLKYPIRKIGEPLVDHALRQCHFKSSYSVEASTTECQQEIRDLLTNMGFETAQVYNKPIMLGIRMMRCQLRMDLTDWAEKKLS